MMRRLSLVVLVSISQVAVAGSFRVAELGKPCAPIPDQEITAGSHPIPWPVEDAAFIAFRTELMGEEVMVVYECRDGLLLAERYFFPYREVEESLEQYRKVYDALSSRYGTAWVDNTPWQPNADPQGIEKDPKRYFVTWRNSESRITIALIPREYTPASERHVFLVVSADDDATPAQPEASPNNG